MKRPREQSGAADSARPGRGSDAGGDNGEVLESVPAVDLPASMEIDEPDADPDGADAARGPDAGGDGAGAFPRAPAVDPAVAAHDRAASYLDQLQRLQAEFDNYRKRMRREQEDWFRQAQADVVARFLPMLDDLHRARGHAGPESPPDAAGMLMILKRFEDVLTKAGLEEQQAEPGTTFDPEQHEALLAAPSDSVAEGAILQVVEPGYHFQGKLLRRSKVSCSTGPAPE